MTRRRALFSTAVFCCALAALAGYAGAGFAGAGFSGEEGGSAPAAETKPEGGEAKPAGTEAKPAGTEAKQAGGTKPAGGEAKPAGGETKPAARPAKPAAGDSKPAGGEPEEAELAPGETVKVVKQPETYLEFAVAGGPLMVPIGLCSIFWLAFLAERLVATRKSRVLPAPFVLAMNNISSAGRPDVEKVKGVCDAHPSAAARVLRAALDHLSAPREELEEAVNRVAQREIHDLKRYIRLFAVIASVAPLLGLLGTVTGLIQCFREVAIQGMGSGQALAPGIYQALITTAGGLMVAIPSLLTYYWFMARVENQLRQIDYMVVDFVEKERRRSGGGPGVGDAYALSARK